MRAILASIEQQLASLARLGFSMAWPLLYGASAGFAAWSARHRALVPTLAKNGLSHEQRIQLAFWAAGGLAAVVLVYLVALVLDRLHSRKFRAGEVLRRGNRQLAGLLTLPVAASLMQPGIESSDPIWTVLMAALGAAAVGVSAYHVGADRAARSDDAASKPPRTVVRSRLEAIATFVVVAGLWGAYGYALSRLAVTNHHALNTRTIDLGYYDNVFYNSIHGRPLGCSFVKGGNHASAHFDPILVVLSPLYLLYPRAEFLLVLQSVWVGMGVIPAYLLGRAAFERKSGGLAMALVYALHPAIHGANLYEFHSLTLISPLVLWLFYFLQARKWLGYGAAVVLLCLCREDLPLMLCFVGMYAILSPDPGGARAGLATVAFSVAYYALARGVFMPSKDLLNSGTDKAYSYAYYFNDLMPNKRGLGDVLLTLVTNPTFVLRHAFGNLQKVQYLAVVFVPLAALPLVARGGLITMAYGLLVCLLASRKPVFQIGFQYASMIVPFAIAVTPRALVDVSKGVSKRFERLQVARMTRALLAFVVAASVLVSWKFGALIENQAFRGGFGKIARYRLSDSQKAEYAELRSLVDQIEPGASVLVTNRVGAHVSNRRDVFLPHQRKVTNYVLVEESDLGKQKQWHQDRIKKKQLELVERAGRFSLYRAARAQASTTPSPSSSASASPLPSASASAAPWPSATDRGEEGELEGEDEAPEPE